jgi:hypothetical protein
MTESKTYNWFEKYSWIFACLVSLGILIGSIWWLYHDWNFEPALAAAAAGAALISQLFNRGVQGLFYILGLFSGAILAGLLIYFIPRFDAENINAQLAQVKSQKETAEKENNELKQKISELTTPSQTPTSAPTPAATQTSTPTPTATSTPTSALTQEVKDIQYKIVSCKSVSGNVVIKLKATSLNSDAQITIGNNSTISIPDRKPLNLPSGIYNNRLHKGIEYPIELVFPNAGDAPVISLLYISIASSLGDAEVEFRDLKVSK